VRQIFLSLSRIGFTGATAELEKLIPGATLALGIVYVGKPSEKLPKDGANPRWFQLACPNISRLSAPILLSLRTG